MNIDQLHKITGDLIAKKRGNLDVMINLATFTESENGTIHEIQTAKVQRVQGADDSGLVGSKIPMLVLSGGAI